MNQHHHPLPQPHRPPAEAAAAAALFDPETAADFWELPRPLPAGTDRRLGYFGEGRFVAFHYEPRGEEVVWDDGRSYGFASGAWCYFADRVAPLAERHGFHLGFDPAGAHPASDVLLIDRLAGRAYFAPRDTARRLLGRPRRRRGPAGERTH